MGMLRERLRYTWTAYFAKPASQRCLHRSVRRHRVRRILELGIGDASRAKSLIRTASLHEATAGGTAAITYAAIDLFEARPAFGVVDGSNTASRSNTTANERLLLKEAYRRLKPTGAQIRLLPGAPYSALTRAANDLGKLDMIIVDADIEMNTGTDTESESPDPAWFYVPRLLHDDTQFWTAHRRDDGEVRYELVPLADIHALGRQAELRRRAATVAASQRRGAMRRAA